MSEVAYQFVKDVFTKVPDGALPVVCGFKTDPNKVRQWPARPVNGHWPEFLDDEMNLYFLTSSIRPNGEGKYRATRNQVAATHCFMLDDIGDGEGSKSDGGKIQLEPTWVIETSPGNHQYIYVLNEPLTDSWMASKIANHLAGEAGTDGSTKNIVRWVRMPGGVNTKLKYLVDGVPPKTSVVDGESWMLYSVEEIIEAFNVPLTDKPVAVDRVVESGDDYLLQWLYEDSGLMNGRVNEEGWHSLTCPWVDGHTDGFTNGHDTYYVSRGEGDGKAEDGGDYETSGFKCHHDHCSDRGAGDLLGWARGKGFNSALGDFEELTDDGVKSLVVASSGGAGSISDDDLDAMIKMECMGLKEFLRRYYFVADGPSVVDMDAPRAHASYKMPEWNALTAPYMTKKKGKSKKDEKLVPTNLLWKNSAKRKNLRGFGYKPGADAVITDENDLKWFNTYHPAQFPTVEGCVHDEDVSVFLEHIAFLIPSEVEREWFTDWVAYNIQYPGERPKICPLLIAPYHGMGRGWLVELMGDLLGHRNCTTTKLKTMVDEHGGGYHGYLHKTVFCAIHEVREGGKNAFAISEQVRDLLTEPRLRINIKYGADDTQDVYTSFLLMSNALDALVLTQEDRRVWVSTNMNPPMEQSYYKRLYDWKDGVNGYPNGAVGKVYWWLMGRDLAHFDAKGNAPMTPSKMEMIDAGMTSTKGAVLQLINNPPAELMVIDDILNYVREIVGELDVTEALNVNKAEVIKVLKTHCSQLRSEDGTVKQLQWKSNGKVKNVRPWCLKNKQIWGKRGNASCKAELWKVHPQHDDEW
jgi:hypothetical protein